jgi:hypothetical protein
MSIVSKKGMLIPVLNELPAERVTEVLDSALSLQERSQIEDRIERLFDSAERLRLSR